jgi:hypothetical protein
MKHTLAALLLAAGLAACASTEAPPPVPERATLSEEAFKTLYDAAYWAKPPAESEKAFAALIARDDLTTDQLAEAYYGRGLVRGIWVRDFPMGFPQCSVVDLAKVQELSPEHKLIGPMKENLTYQFSRFQYFGDAPLACRDGAEAVRLAMGY